MEILHPGAGENDIQVNCGIRIHGNGSRNPDGQRKHGFRLEFRRLYGPATTGGDEDLIRQRLWKTLEYPFEIDITYHETLERSRSGKFEDFKSELAAPSSQAA